jgi:hypothetical protein
MLKLPDVSAGPWTIRIDPPDEFQPQITVVLPHPPASNPAFGTTFIAARATAGTNKEVATTTRATVSTRHEPTSFRSPLRRHVIFIPPSSPGDGTTGILVAG